MHEVKPLEAVNEGDRATVTKTITEADGAMYIASTGDFGPVHVDQGFAAGTRFGERIAPGIMVAGICTSILTSRLVGILGVSIEDRFWFTGPVLYGDTITFDVWIAEKRTEERTVIWEASARNQNGLEVLKARASAQVAAPSAPGGAMMTAERISPARTVSESDIALFAGLSADFSPVHSDAAYAARGVFGRRVAHGLLGMSLAEGLLSRTPGQEAPAAAWEWSFDAPIFAGGHDPRGGESGDGFSPGATVQPASG